MKKILCFALVLCLFLCGCGSGEDVTGQVEFKIGPSQLYTEEEIRAAMEVLRDDLLQNGNPDGWRVQVLTYDEEISAAESERWAEMFRAEEAIVLGQSVYKNNDFLLNLNLGGDYAYKWVLTRSGNENWVLRCSAVE